MLHYIIFELIYTYICVLYIQFSLFQISFLLLFKYSCLRFHPTMPPYPTHPHLPPSNPPPLALPMCPLYVFLNGPSPIIPLPSPLWLLSVCSLFQCLWLYFACLFVLIIRFHLQVRSYGISLSPPGLFQLA